MSLGEAFIEVRADTRPFVRDLDAQIRRAVQRAEGSTTTALTNSLGRAGERAGDEGGRRAGDSFNRRMRNTFNKKGGSSNPFVAVAGALASALDDGISALPTEVKAAIVGGIILAAPLAGAILAAAVTTALGLAVAGIGTLLAFQFVDVQAKATDVGRDLRVILARSAEAFGPAVLNALDLVENKIESLEPVLKDVFTTAAGFVEPITAALLEGVGGFVEMLQKDLPKIEPFIDIFAVGLQQILDNITEGLDRFASSGRAGQQALKDLFTIINLLIGALFGTLELLIHINQAFHDLVNLVIDFNPLIGALLKAMGKDFPEANGAIIATNTEAASSFDGVIAATKKEEQEAKLLAKTLDKLNDATYNSIQVNVDYERSLDKISDSLEENGKTLDIHTEKGRQNVEAFTRGLKDAEQAALDKVQTQGYTAEQAAQYYDQEIAQIRALAHEAGITDEEFNQLYGSIIDVSRQRVNGEEMGIDALAESLGVASLRAAGLASKLDQVANKRLGGFGVGIKGYADGDIVNRPTLATIAESGPEVVIPLTQPARAAQLMQESGLSTLIGNNGSVVMVFIGDEQLDAKMVKVVERNNRNQALALSQGPRRF